MINVLHISPNFNLACGVSKNVFTILSSTELRKEFNLHFITNRGDALQKLEKADINYSIFDFKTNKIFQFDLHKNIKWLKKYCEEKEIGIIHSHHRYPEYLSNRIKKTHGIKTVVTVHNFVSGFKHFSYKSDRVIAINNSVKEHLDSLFDIDPDRVEVLYNCIRNEQEVTINEGNIKQSLGISKDCLVILYIGRIIKEKGIEILIDAFKLLSAQNKNMTLLIVGSGDISLDDMDTDKIKTYPPTEEVHKFYAIADIVVLPSLKEPFGYTMIEAGLNKIPFIGSRTGGISEFIEDGINGYLIEPGNSVALSEKIRYLINHPDEGKNAALKLNEKVLRLCNCKEYFQKICSIYQTLLYE